jgi:protein JSN1
MIDLEFRPPTMYYTTIPLVSERQHNRRWDASKLRELRKRLDSGTMTVEEVDQVAADFLDGEIVDLASDWLGNTVCMSMPDLPCSHHAVLGCPETVREVFARSQVCDAGTYRTTSGNDRHS